MDKSAESTSNDEKIKNFHEMGLDDRILKAIAKLGWKEPTLIQERAIPLILEGKDVLVKAPTGTGKTGAFVIPIIQKILDLKENSTEQCVRALILAPTKELCNQIHANSLQLTAKCSRDVKVVDISPQLDIAVQKPLLVDSPDIVVATPARALKHINAKNLNLQHLKVLIVDEADLMFSYGYEDDAKEVLKHLPRVYQAILASATLSEDVVSLKKLLLHNAVTLKLQESELSPISQLSHYKLFAEKDDKPAVLCALLKLGLVRGKIIIFTNTVDKCYKVKLFLEQFALPSCVLNSELPAAVRCHVVSQFNQGKYDILIASDEATLDNPFKPDSTVKSKRNKDKESGTSRGIDFQCVSNIINFDFPLTFKSYVHRAGRTARGKNKGTVLSLVNVTENIRLIEIDHDLKQGLATQCDSVFKQYNFKMEDIESFKYRSSDAWRAATRIAVREARLKEIKTEILNSEKLKGYFDANPRDYKTLRHDKPLKTVKIQPHLANVPDYVIPDSLKNVAGLIKVKKPSQKINQTTKYQAKPNARMKYKAKLSNPLSCLDEGVRAKKRRTK